MAWFTRDTKDEDAPDEASEDILIPEVSGEKETAAHPSDDVSAAFDERTKTVLDSVGEGVLIFDQKLIVRYQNREANRLLGPVIGRALESFAGSITPVTTKVTDTADPLPADELPPRRALRDNVPIKKTVIWKVNESVSHSIEFLATPLRIDGVTKGVVVALRNVEQELKLEEELREFIAIASHQFRTPLASISWFMEILLSGKLGELNKQQWEVATQAREAVTRLKDTIHLTLNASTAEVGAMEITPEPHDIGELLEAEVQHSGLFAQSRKQNIRLVLPRTTPTMPVDETIFRFIMMNLLSNAMKYSPEGGEIVVTVVSEARRLMISVQDSGLGIPKEDQARIFNKFFRAENVLMKSDGTGLGLYIVKKLVDAVGGDIWFESEEGKGTTFTVSFPREGFKKVEGHSQLSPLSKSMYGNS